MINYQSVLNGRTPYSLVLGYSRDPCGVPPAHHSA